MERSTENETIDFSILKECGDSKYSIVSKINLKNQSKFSLNGSLKKWPPCYSISYTEQISSVVEEQFARTMVTESDITQRTFCKHINDEK